ncbi:MAG: hypothetical protein IPL73_09780 [Candidatus Obscuribacter sp.]|nr:hypothetical protein [Candidatus Obscuribacter sp.]
MLDVIQKQTRNEIKNYKEAHATVQPAFSPQNEELKKLESQIVNYKFFLLTIAKSACPPGQADLLLHHA